ncbi:MAG: hypothetical protein J0653_04220, partial [Deltaproteobacteria bacterium]|nr:hypothetical protein [Deltaproteobacteria bacterium]
PELLTLPPHGCLNIHPGLLPQYKGVDPVIHALAAGEEQFGVTVHFQDQGFDTGPVITSGSIAIQEDDSLLTLNCRLFHYGIQLLGAALAPAGVIPPAIPQKHADGYDSWPNAGLVAKVCKAGRKLLGTPYSLVK